MKIKSAVLILILNSTTWTVNTWILSTRVSQANANCVLIVLYRSPSASKAEFLNYFEGWCEENFSVMDNNIICGDFNINMLRSGNCESRSKFIIEENCMKQFVNYPTRITQFTETLIYLVCSNIEVCVDVLCDEKISDHSTLLIDNAVFKDKEFGKKIENRIKSNSAERMCGYLTDYEWDSTINVNLN